MDRILAMIGLRAVLASAVLVGAAVGQATPPQNVPAQNVVSASSPLTPSHEGAPVTDTPDIVVDPASLLPDLPPVPKAKASLIGGTIGRMDRVRDQLTLQLFGGGKMTVAFDPRTHIYSDSAEASTSDLRRGDRVYVETILDGSTVFARTIKLKRSTVAGESQGIITSYRADRGELVLHDALSPQPVKIRIDSQTRVVQGDRTESASKLAAGTLVAIKFGPRRDGGEVAREISVLAVPGTSFTFVGQVTAIDLRLGLLVLNSTIDHKTYEIAVDPTVVGVDENVRPSAEVTVVTRFEGNRYMARSIKVNSANQQ